MCSVVCLVINNLEKAKQRLEKGPNQGTRSIAMDCLDLDSDDPAWMNVGPHFARKAKSVSESFL